MGNQFIFSGEGWCSSDLGGHRGLGEQSVSHIEEIAGKII